MPLSCAWLCYALRSYAPLSCEFPAYARPFCALLSCAVLLRPYALLACVRPFCALRSCGRQSGVLLTDALLFCELLPCALWFYGPPSFWLPSYAVQSGSLLRCGPQSCGPSFCELRFWASLFCEVLFCGRRWGGQLLYGLRPCAVFQVFSADGSWAWVTDCALRCGWSP